MQFFELKHYISYLLRAKDEYSLHSPFVFAFYNALIKRKKQPKGFKKQQIICQTQISLPSYKLIQSNEEYTIKDIADKIKNPYNIIIIDNQYKTQNDYLKFQDLKALPYEFISLDFFSFVLIISNPKILKKQHYLLKKK